VIDALDASDEVKQMMKSKSFVNNDAQRPSEPEAVREAILQLIK